MQFFSETTFVATYLIILFVFAIMYLARSNEFNSFESSIVGVSFFLFGYALFPLFLYSADGIWFTRSVPPVVSRVVVIGFAILCLVDISRRWQVSIAIRFTLFIFFSSSLFLISTFLEKYLIPAGWMGNGSQFKYTVIFILFFGLACFVAIRNTMDFNFSFPSSVLYFIGLVTLLAFFEVAYDLAPVKNMVRGHVESRASSTFHNPNWFALAVAPAIFLACKASYCGRSWYALYLFGAVSLTLVLSGSRSAVSVLITALFVFAILLYRNISASSFKKLFSTGIAGLGLGSFAGLIGAFIVGKDAPERYFALIDRIALWPIYILSDNQAQQSVIGRLALEQGQVVDNAYLFWLQHNTISGILLILLMTGVLALSIKSYFDEKSFDASMRVAVAVFVVASGGVGQVFWAFPVWPIYAICLGYVLRPIATYCMLMAPWRN